MSGISLKGQEAWRVDDQLPPDSYMVVLAEKERTASSNQNPQVKLTWRVDAGEYRGAEQLDWVTFTDPALGRVVQLLDACGISLPDDNFDSHQLLRDWVDSQLVVGKTRCEAVVRMEPDRNDATKEWPRIKGYRKPMGGSDVPNDTSGFANGASAVKNSDVPF